MTYSQERKPSAELRPKQAVLIKLAPPHQRTVKDVAAPACCRQGGRHFPRDPLPKAWALSAADYCLAKGL